MSRRCPKCKTVYAGEARFCPKDGSPLVDVAGSGGRPVSAPAPKTEVRKASKSEGPSMSRAGQLTDQVLDRRYQIRRKLGEGGMAFVYEAHDMSTGHGVAVKVLSPKLSKDTSSVERLRREAGLAMRLEHPNALKILRLQETEDGLIYLVMPYLKGELLSDWEVKRGQIPPAEGVDILVQCCAGLHHAHKLNIVHRDLKPENIMMVKDESGLDQAIVMDFGLAKENRAGPGVAKLTATGIILGTPEFMSPEQIRGKELDARSDVYALGIVGFEMFTGKLPFQGRTPQEMMIARLRGKPIPVRTVLPDFPKKLEAVIMKSLESEPGNRYGTALEFGKALLDAGESVDKKRLKKLLK